MIALTYHGTLESRCNAGRVGKMGEKLSACRPHIVFPMPFPSLFANEPLFSLHSTSGHATVLQMWHNCECWRSRSMGQSAVDLGAGCHRSMGSSMETLGTAT